MLGAMDKMLEQPVIDAMQLLPKVRGGAQQEPAPRLGVGKTRQSGQILEGAIGLQERGGFQAIQAQDDGINQREQHLRKTVALVAPGVSQVPGDKIPDLQHSCKFVKEVYTPVMRQTPVIAGDS